MAHLSKKEFEALKVLVDSAELNDVVSSEKEYGEKWANQPHFFKKRHYSQAQLAKKEAKREVKLAK